MGLDVVEWDWMWVCSMKRLLRLDVFEWDWMWLNGIGCGCVR